jgi:hypothetical protein
VADRLHVADRLAEGRPAVEHTETYARACHVLGYQHPDLTAQPGQIRDWYDSEEGLDLRALDRDCAELRAAGAAVMEALRMQRAQVAELAAAWAGPGGDSAVRFLERHCDAANVVATEVRAAAQRCESLRDNLWYLVDSKVATAIAIDDRTRAQRPAWLAAAAAVTTGVGDRPSAEEMVRQQITPYVDNEIRDDWLTTMRSTVEGVDTSYDMVTDRMAAAPAARFDVPGDLGPGYQPLPPGATTPAAPVSPIAVSGPSADPVPAPALTTAAPAAPAAGAPAGAAPAAIPATPLPDLGTAAAMPASDVGGGLGGLGGLANRIVDAMGSLLGSAADQFGDEGSLDDEDPFHADDVEDKHDEPDEAKEVDETRDAEAAKPAEEARPVDARAPVGAPPVEGAPVEGAPAPMNEPAPVAAPEPVAAPPTSGPAPPVNEGSTPCEIAADQLPQAGQ